MRGIFDEMRNRPNEVLRILLEEIISQFDDENKSMIKLSNEKPPEPVVEAAPVEVEEPAKEDPKKADKKAKKGKKEPDPPVEEEPVSEEPKEVVPPPKPRVHIEKEGLCENLTDLVG